MNIQTDNRMNKNEFIRFVIEMRKHQLEYSISKSIKALKEARSIEKVVDEKIYKYRIDEIKKRQLKKSLTI